MTSALSVSVVIPVYNAERYIGKAIESALRQTHPPLEVIVIDDGSTDSTADVANSFGDRIRCVRQANAGPARARNRGVRESRGEFVAFLDADDEWLPEHLEEAARVLDRHTDLVWFSGSYERRTEGTEAPRPMRYSGPLEQDAYIGDYFAAQAKTEFSWTGVMVIRKDVIVAEGGFDEELRGDEDVNLWFRIALQHPRIGHSRKVTAIYWVRPGSLTVAGATSMAKRVPRFIRKLDRAAQAAPAAARRQSEPLIALWVRYLVRYAISENNREALAEVRAQYPHRLRLVQRCLLLAARFLPCPWIEAALGVGSRVKRLLKKLLGRASVCST